MITFEQIETLWLGVVAQMPARTPKHVVAILRADFMINLGTGNECDPLHIVLTQLSP